MIWEFDEWAKWDLECGGEIFGGAHSTAVSLKDSQKWLFVFMWDTLGHRVKATDK